MNEEVDHQLRGEVQSVGGNKGWSVEGKCRLERAAVMELAGLHMRSRKNVPRLDKVSKLGHGPAHECTTCEHCDVGMHVRRSNV
jgi:hypothetical protein